MEQLLNISLKPAVHIRPVRVKTPGTELEFQFQNQVP